MKKVKKRPNLLSHSGHPIPTSTHQSIDISQKVHTAPKKGFVTVDEHEAYFNESASKPKQDGPTHQAIRNASTQEYARALTDVMIAAQDCIAASDILKTALIRLGNARASN